MTIICPTINNNNNSNNNNNNNNNNSNNNKVSVYDKKILPPTSKRNPTMDSQLKQQPHPWDDGVKISKDDYDFLQECKQNFRNQKNRIINEQIEKSQNNNMNEGFANINDDFNDVLLFGLLGIFFLVFIDYIYKLGRKSY